MDNNQNQSNAWSSPQPNQSTAPGWGAVPNQPMQSFTTSPQAGPPPAYQPPVGYADVNMAGVGQAVSPNQTPQPTPMQTNQPPVPGQATTASTTIQAGGLSYDPMTGQFLQPNAAANQIESPQPAPTPAVDSSTPSSTSVKPPRPANPNQSMYIIAGLVSIVSLAVVVICIMLVLK